MCNCPAASGGEECAPDLIPSPLSPLHGHSRLHGHDDLSRQGGVLRQCPAGWCVQPSQPLTPPLSCSLTRSGCVERWVHDPCCDPDLVFYGSSRSSISHVAIYVGGGNVVSHGSDPVRHCSMNYRSDLQEIRSYL